MDYIEVSYKLLKFYTQICKEVTQKYQLTQTEFDILLFLANHPHYHSAKDIVKVRGIKANLVSMSVEKLVQKGLLLRKEIHDDRRTTHLILTQETTPIIVEGKRIQRKLVDCLFDGVTPQEKAEFIRIVAVIYSNIESMRD